MYNEIKQLRRLTGRPFGVNLFMPQPLVADPGAVEVYRHQLIGEAAWYETPWATRTPHGDDGYDAKVAILLHDPVPVVSFTFGCPTREVLDAFAASRHAHRRHGHLAPGGEERRVVGRGRTCVQGVEAAWATSRRTATIPRAASRAPDCSP